MYVESGGVEDLKDSGMVAKSMKWIRRRVAQSRTELRTMTVTLILSRR